MLQVLVSSDRTKNNRDEGINDITSKHQIVILYSQSNWTSSFIYAFANKLFHAKKDVWYKVVSDYLFTFSIDSFPTFEGWGKGYQHRFIVNSNVLILT